MPIANVDFNTVPEDELLVSLGKVLVRASQTEHSLRLLIKDLAGRAYGEGMAKTNKSSNLGSLKDCLCSMVGTGQYSRIRALDAAGLKKLRKIMSDTIAVAELRNRICHTCWAVGAKKVPDEVLSDFHKKAAKLMNSVEEFRHPRFHEGTKADIKSW